MLMTQPMHTPKPKSPSSSSPALSLDGWFAGTQHIYPLRVQYEDTDAGGVVYHAGYLAYAERGRSAAFTLLGIDQMALLAEGLAFVVANLTIRYQQAARLGDILQVATTATAISRASIKLSQIITGLPNNNTLPSDSPIATLEVTIVQTRVAGIAEGAKEMDSKMAGKSEGKTGGIVRLSDEVMRLVRTSFFSPKKIIKK